MAAVSIHEPLIRCKLWEKEENIEKNDKQKIKLIKKDEPKIQKKDSIENKKEFEKPNNIVELASKIKEQKNKRGGIPPESLGGDYEGR